MATHSYWRVNVSANNGAGDLFTEIFELQFREIAGATQQATGGTAFASSIYSTSNTASDAFDNTTTTAWASVAGILSPQYIGYHFSVPLAVAEVQLIASPGGSYAPKNFTIEYSDDNVVWYIASTITNQTGWDLNIPRLFPVSVMSLSGTITESSAITDWRISATACNTGTGVGTALSTGTTYTIDISQATPCNITLAPKIDYAWSANKIVLVGDYVVSATPDTTSFLWKATVASDRNYLFAHLLLDFNGADAGIVFTDLSSPPNTVSLTGATTKTSTTSPYAGTACLYNSSATTSYISIATGTANRFTVRGKFKPTSAGLNIFFVQNTGSELLLGVSTVGLWGRLDGSAFSFAQAISSSAWSDIEFAHDGTTLRCFIDGALVYSFTHAVVAAIGCKIGGVDSNAYVGYIDNLEYYLDTCLHTTSFTPPTSLPIRGVTGTTEPIWNLTGTTVDNNVTWTYIAPLVDPVTIGPKIPI